jgi:hypothetical protein
LFRAMRSDCIRDNLTFRNGTAQVDAVLKAWPGDAATAKQSRVRMKISVDDWHFRTAEGDSLVLDLFLDNGQHALVEVNPMRNLHLVNGEVPEIIIFGEFPGESLQEASPPARWIARPPAQQCPWSHVQLPPVLFQQIQQHLASPTRLPAC